MTKRFNQKSGFTLIELLLGITISVVIFLTASSFVVLIFNTDINSKRTQAIEQAKYTVQQELSTAIKWGQQVNFGNGELIIDNVVYKLDNGVFTKDGNPLTSYNVDIKSFDIVDRSVIDTLKSLDISMNLTHRNFPSVQDSFRVVVSQRLLTIEGGDIPDEILTPPDTPRPTPRPSQTPRPSMSTTPRPSPSRTPTGSAKATGTPKPTPIPTPKPTPKPTPSPTPPGR